MIEIEAIDICSGAGGWACAADRLEGKPVKIVAVVDRDEDSLETYKLNHCRPGGVAEGAEFILHDAITINYQRFTGIKLVLGGIPCETISVARQNAPAGGAELFIWLDLLKAMLGAIETINPTHWCYEDVVQVLNYVPSGTPFFKINSDQFSPQSRIRAYLGNCPIPLAQNDPRTLKDCIIKAPAYLPLTTFRKKPNPRGSAWYDPGTYRALGLNEKVPTIMNGSKDYGSHVIHFPNGHRRCMTIPEQARAQGFPDDYIFLATQRRMAKMVGQAIQIDTGVAILEGIVEALAA